MIIDLGQPGQDELEITTLGAGASNGESVVIHLTGDEWIIIDSCKVGDEVLPLNYLDSIGVAYDKVSKVICTHWHTDHIRGLPDILASCRNAQFYLANVSDYNGYLNIVLKAAGFDPMDKNVWNVLNNCLIALEQEGKREPHMLNHNQRVVHLSDGVDIFVVGPSDEMVKRFDASLLRIDINKPETKAINNLEENLCSMAFSVHFNGVRALIGGDLETGRKTDDKYNYKTCLDNCPQHDECGWCEAIKKGNVFDDEKPYHFIKLPHHSSVSAYCPKMWVGGFVEGGPIATTTVFNNAESEDLPTREMLSIYHDKCKALYITYSDGQAEQTVEENKAISILMEEGGIDVIDNFTEQAGVIICRWRSHEEGWKVKCYGEARLVNEGFLRGYHSECFSGGK